MNIPIHQQFSEQEQQIIKRLFLDGRTHTEIGNELGYQRRTIGKICKYLGLQRSVVEAAKLKIKSPLDTPATLQTIKQMREAGDSLDAIRNITGGSITAIDRICLKHGFGKPSIDFSNLKAEYESDPTLTLKQLGKKYGTSSQTIFMHLHNLNAKLRNPAVLGFKGSSPKKNKPDYAKIVSDYQQLRSMSKVAAKYEYSVAGIRNILERHGVVILNSSQILSGEGNPFFGKHHSDDVKEICRQIGSVNGRKFWDDNSEYVMVVREKQRVLWNDLEKRKRNSEFVSRLRAEGKCGSRKGSIETRFGTFAFDSSFELRFIEHCVADSRVVDLERDFDFISYQYDGNHIFIPDFRVWFSNGEFLIVEVKSDWYAKKPKERAKIEAAFGLLATKFMVVNDDLDAFKMRVDTCFNPVEFGFNDLVLARVSSEQYVPFYGCFHYLGKTGRRGHTLGAFLNDRLVGCATIGSISRNQTATKCGVLPAQIRELVRFCIHPDFQKKNFASWLLSRVIKNYKNIYPDVIKFIAFSDTTQGHTGTIYKASGWCHCGMTKPSYHYVDNGGTIIYKKTIWNKAQLLNISERDYAVSHHLMRVVERPKERFLFDC